MRSLLSVWLCVPPTFDAVGGSWASTAFGEPRFTNDVDILADFTFESLARFLAALPTTFFADPEEARKALQYGRPFNVIYVPMAFKFDFFSAASFSLGSLELDRAILLSDSGLSETPTPFVTPEDILLAKPHWFLSGEEVSDTQWRDIQGIVRNRAATLDRTYLQQNAATLGVLSLLEKALSGQ